MVTDGAQALQFLRKEPPFEGVRKPDLVLLDLNLPILNGNEVLSQLKKDPDLRRVPVVVLTSSSAETDVVKSYDLGANCYITKPVGLEAFEEIVNSIQNFWFAVVRLPAE